MTWKSRTYRVNWVYTAWATAMIAGLIAVNIAKVGSQTTSTVLWGDSLSVSSDQFPVTSEKIKTVKFRVTGYCPCRVCCGKWSDGKFADGTAVYRWSTVQDQLVAAAPKNIPFGTKIDIPGYGIATVRDRGGAIYDNGIDLPRLDVFFFTHQEALDWGVQRLECIVKRGTL